MESFYNRKWSPTRASMFLIMYVVMFAVERCDSIVVAGGTKRSVGIDTANHEDGFNDAEDNSVSDKHQSTVDKRTADYGDHDFYSGHYGDVNSGYSAGGHGHAVHHNHHHYDAALKSLLIPLAGIALLGVAAVFASNPVLLQLGVTSGKRRRRHAPVSTSLEAVQRKLNDISLLERFIDQVPEKELEVQEKRLLANYFACSGITNGTRSLCLERLSCEMQHPSAPVTDIERHVMNIIVSEIINNEFIATSTKEGIRRARQIGLHGGGCNVFPCNKADIERL